MYEFMVKKLVYPLTQRLIGRQTLAFLQSFERTQFDPPEVIVARQWERLKAVLVHAYENVPYYRQTFNAIGLTPGDMRRPEDWNRIPLLSKDQVRTNSEALIASGYGRRLIEVRTGGSTGTPLRHFATHECAAADNASMWRARRWWGIDIGDRAVHFWGHAASFAPGWRGWRAKVLRPFRDLLMNRRVLSAYNMSESSMAHYWRILKTFRPRYILGHASSLFIFARFLKSKGIDGRQLALQVVISTSEMLYPEQRKLIEEVFGCRVLNEYGATEMGIIAYECPEGNLHLMDDTLFVEVYKPEGAEEDDLGEVVVTQLYNMGAPLIRYRLGDAARSISVGCACGVGLRLLNGLSGRAHDLIVTPDGRYVHGEFFTHLFDQMRYVKKFQVIQEGLDWLSVLIVPDQPGAFIDEVFLRRHIQAKFGDNVSVEIRYVDEIPQERSGKYRWIVSRLPENTLELRSRDLS